MTKADPQLELFEVPSPCQRICQTDSNGYCIGCLRSRQERFEWLELNNQQKREVLRLCYQRKKRIAYAHYKAQQQKKNQTPSQQLTGSLFDS